MTGPPNRAQQQPQGRRRRSKKPKSLDLWRAVPQLGEAEPVTLAGDPTAVLRSLGDPPLQGQGAVAQHYMAAVVERAAGLAAALAASADLLAEPDEDD